MSKINIAGRIGNDFETSNAHSVEIHKNYNGSGDDAFGGAREWPHVTALVGFQVGEERRALNFSKKLVALIKEEFKQ
jgi:hypothetical protein